MAELGPITVTINARLGTTSLPARGISFEVPLRSVETTSIANTEATFDIVLDRTELRDQMTKAVKDLADNIEASFLTAGSVLLTCEVCGHEIASDTVSVLRHESDGAHSLHGYLAPARPSSGTLTIEGEAVVQGELKLAGEATEAGQTELPDDVQTDAKD